MILRPFLEMSVQVPGVLSICEAEYVLFVATKNA